MKFAKLNPHVRSCAMREIIYRNEECISYDARLYYLLSGDISLTANGEKYKLTGGNLIYIPSGVRYRFKGHRMLMACISFDLTADFADSDSKSPAAPEEFCEAELIKCELAPLDKVLFLADADSEREAFTELCELATAKEGEWQAEISAKLKLILISLAAMTDDGALPPRMVKNLDGYIRENRRDEISNTELGAIFGYHPFYISNKLKSAKGMTLHQYVIAYRMKLAKALLRYTDKSVNEIAEEAGFKDASYFTKSFKASVGVTPKVYRTNFKNEFI